MFFETTSIEIKKSSNNEYEKLQSGVYYAKIIDIDIRDNKKKNGKIVEITFETEGLKKKEIFNIIHENEYAQRIGREKFAELIFATCKEDKNFKNELEVSRHLLGKEFVIKSYKYKKKNGIEEQDYNYYTTELINRNKTKLEKIEKEKIDCEDLPF